MSRIHEALKKAARERSTQLSTGSGRGAVEIAAEIPRPAGTEPSFARLPEQGRVAVAVRTNDGKDFVAFGEVNIVSGPRLFKNFDAVHGKLAQDDI